MDNPIVLFGIAMGLLLLTMLVGVLYVRRQKPSTIRYGSKQWFASIADVLKDRLVGIELDDNSKSNVPVSPPVQVTFIVPFDYDVVAPEVKEAAKFMGFRGLYQVWRGKNKGEMLQTVTFDFRDEKYYPDKKDLIAVAKEHGLTYIPKWLNKDGYTSRLAPKLYK